MWSKISMLIVFAFLLAMPASAAVSSEYLDVIPLRDYVYKTTEAGYADLNRVAEYSASVIWPESAAVKAERPGTVRSYNIKRYMPVKKGDVIAEIETERNELLIEEKALLYDIALKKDKRQRDALNVSLDEQRRRLAELKAGGGNKISLRLQEIAVERAAEERDFYVYDNSRKLELMKSELDELRENSADFAILSPFDGYITDAKYLREGDMLSAGDVLCVVTDYSAAQLIALSGDLGALKCGAAVDIVVTGRDSVSMPGHIVSNTFILGSKAPRTYAIAEFDNISDVEAFVSSSDRVKDIFSFYSDLKFSVQINRTDVKNTLVVPRKDTIVEGDLLYVNILEDGMLKKRYISAGLSDNENIQVLEGLSEGDIVVRN